MATPAQLAARKIKAPKSRTGRSTTPTLGSSSFGGQQQQSQPNFSFGNASATQSFPPPNQQQSFNFSVPNTSSSFTFGQTNNDSQQVSNPFAAMNGSTGGQDNSMMQDSASQQPSTNGVFGGFNGFPQTTPAPSTNGAGFNFGQSSSTGFGGGSVFGQQKPQEEPQPAFSAGLFGAQPQSQSNGFSSAFGQTSSPSFPATTSADRAPSPFGGIPSPAPAPTFKFGETSVTDNKSATPEPVESTTPKAKPLFNFGQPSTFAQSTPEAAPPASAPAKPLFSFGQPSNAPANSPPSTTPSKPLFGMSSAVSNPPEPATAPAKPLFNFGEATSKSADQEPVANPFGTPSKSAEPVDSGTSFFGRASPAADSQASSTTGANTTEDSTEPDKPNNPFAGMFGAKPTTAPPNTTKSGFQFGSPAKQPDSAAAPANLPTVSDKRDKPQSLFGFPAAAPTSDNTASTKPSTASSSNSLFNLNKPTPSAETEKPLTQSQPSSSLFSKTNEMNSNAGSTPFKTFGQTPLEDAGPAKKKLFQSPTAAESMSQLASGQNELVPGPTEPVQPKFTQPQRSLPAKETVTRAVSTEGPPQIPRYLSADKYRSYDENWRLKALNRKFKRVIAAIDPDREDFLSTVQNYLDHRESIGEGLAMWIKKQTAGSKRKPDDVDDMQTERESSKRPRPDSASTTKPAPSASSLFGSVPSPKPATNSTQARPSGQNTSTMFKSLIPGATSAPPAAQTAAPTFSFTPTPAKSTTPPASPPKNSAPQMPQFDVPKFGGGSADFASAFAKNAASSVEKAEREAKAKRKAEEFDSDEDDEAEWEKKYEEEQRQKKAKLSTVSKTGFLPAFIPSASSTRSNSPFAFAAPPQVASAPRSDSAQPLSESEKAVNSIESDGEGRTGSTSGESAHAGNESGNSGDDEDEEEDDVHEDQAAEQPEEEEEGEPIPDLPKGESLFDRISKPAPSTSKTDQPIFGSAAKPYYKPAIMFDGLGKESPEQPTFSPFTPKGDFKPATSFNFTASTSGPSFGSSLIKDGPIPGEGLFGSRPSTPQPGTAKESTSVFGSTSMSSAPSNNTWTKGSPIKFAESTSDQDAPSIEVSAATPPQASKSTSGSGFFGAASSNGGSVGFNFGGASSQPAPGYLAAASHLSTGGTSGFSSRGSSPGLVSEAESVATDASTTQDEEHSNQPQISLMASNAGEENEDVLFEAKAQLSRNFRKIDLPENTRLVEGWNKIGTGNVKLLKAKADGKCRIVFRAEPNANILLNTRLVAGGSYKSNVVGKNGALTFPVAVEKGMQTWMLRIKTKEQTDSLAKIIDENKAA